MKKMDSNLESQTWRVKHLRVQRERERTHTKEMMGIFSEALFRPRTVQEMLAFWQSKRFSACGAVERCVLGTEKVF